MSAKTPTRLNRAHIRRHCERAIARRVGYAAPEAVRNVYHQGEDVIVIVNSGGNALEIETCLRQRGYVTEQAGKASDGYGCAVRVGLQSAPSSP